MSLISDALNKARQEAARQEAVRQRVPYAVGAIEPPRRGATGPLLAGILVGCLAVGGLFGVAYLAGWGPWQEVKPEPGPAVAEAPPPLASAPTPAADPSIAPTQRPPLEPVKETPSPKPPPDAVPPPAETPPPQPSPVPVAPPPVETPPPAVAETPPPALPTPAPPAPPAQPTPSEAKSYVGEVPVPGGGVLRLNGIAFSEQSPVVVLDGRVMGPGESVQGFTIVEIQRDRVRLEGHGETVYVSLK